MKLFRFIGLLLAVGFLVVALGCAPATTTAQKSSVSSSMQSKSNDASLKRIAKLEKDLQKAMSRISALEKKFSATSKAHKTVIAGEGWKSLANWRRLETGMSYDTVRKILGSAHRVDGGTLAHWYYKNGGDVRFFDGRVNGWIEPKRF